MDFQAVAIEAYQAANGLTPKCFAIFRYEAVRNEFKSQQAGFDQFDNVEVVDLHIPGSRDYITQPVNDKIKREYAAQYEAWKRGEERPTEGLPLTQWAELAARPDMVATPKAIHIYTVEELSIASDTAIGKIGMGGFALREKAAKTIAVMKDSSVLRTTLEENANLKLKVEDQATQIAELAERLKALEDEKGKKKK